MNKKITFTQIEIQNIINYYLAPHSLNDTTKYAGIVKTAIIRKLLLENNIPLHSKELNKELQVNKLKDNLRGKKTILTDLLQIPNIKENLIDLYVVQNKKFEELLQIYNTSWATMARLLKTLEIEKPQSWKTAAIKKDDSGKYLIDKELFKNIYDNNTLKYTANYFNISPSLVDSIVTNLDIDRQPHITKMESSISTDETYYYGHLIEQYGEADIIRQYKDKRYPFNCDFYIKSEDKFIELNLHWTHNTHAFDADNEEDRAQLQCWEQLALTSDYYKNAIEVWTKRDPLKLKTLVENNLNFEIIYKLV